MVVLASYPLSVHTYLFSDPAGHLSLLSKPFLSEPSCTLTLEKTSGAPIIPVENEATV